VPNVAHLTAKARTARVNSATQDSDDLVRLLGELRAIWEATAKAEPTRRSKLQGKIVQAIEKLKKQVGDQLTDPSPDQSAFPLFGGQIPDETIVVSDPSPASHNHRFPAAPVLRLYDKDLADQALVALPQASRFSDVEEFRAHLARTLQFNAVSTRRRAATYLTGRYFPCGIIHGDLAQIASVAEGQPWLGDVLFYLTCRVEKLVAMVAEEVVWPSLADGGVVRTRISDYVRGRVPSWSKNSVTDVGAAIVRTYERFGLGKPTRTRLNVSVRQGGLPAFAYVLYLEFPEPGMYGFEKLLHGPMRRWLLWDQDWIVKQLHACEEAGLLAKISEIDRAKQFTTKHTLDEAVGPIVSLTQERST
jgi:hypothetical protein